MPTFRISHPAHSYYDYREDLSVEEQSARNAIERSQFAQRMAEIELESHRRRSQEMYARIRAEYLEHLRSRPDFDSMFTWTRPASTASHGYPDTVNNNQKKKKKDKVDKRKERRY